MPPSPLLVAKQKNPLGESRWDKRQRRKDWDDNPEAFRFDAKPSEAMPPFSSRQPLSENPRRLNPPAARWRGMIFNNNWCVSVRYFDTREEAVKFYDAWWKRWTDYIERLGGSLTWRAANELREHPWGITSNQIDQSWWPISAYNLARRLHPEGNFDWPFQLPHFGTTMAEHLFERHTAAQAVQTPPTITRRMDLSEDTL